MIQIRNLSVDLPAGKGESRRVLNEVSLDVAEGQWVVVAGPSGSGKTTLLRAIAGLVPLSSGTVRVDSPMDGRGFGVVLQDPDDQFVATCVWNELVLSVPEGTAAADVRRRAEEAATRFRLEKLLARNPHRLSGGEKQRLALACLWLSEASVLLLDEPASFLDREGMALCREVVAEMMNKGSSVLWATTGGEDLFFGDRVAYLDEGRLLGEERAGGVIRSFSRELVLPPLFRLARALAEEAKSSKGDESSERGGYKGEEGTSAGGGRGSGKLVNLAGASAAYVKGESVFEAIDLEIFSGEVVGVTGANGSGKTTLLELIAGAIPPSQGNVFLRHSRPYREGKQNVFYLFQNPERMFFAETVLEEMALGLKNIGVPSEEVFSHARHALSQVGLGADLLLNASPFSLSFGQMRCLAFALALSLQPDLLVVDEPTSCLDARGIVALESMLASLRREGRTVVIASHDQDFLLSHVDRLIFLGEGGLRGEIRRSDGRLSGSDPWPGRYRPFLLEIQEALAQMGVAIDPPLGSYRRLADEILTQCRRG